MAEEDNSESDEVMQCAGCGVKEGDDDIKLRNCTACHMVRYCGVKCQRGHWPKHKKECKRAAEKRDEILFKQPETNYPGDCPICFVPIPIDGTKSSLYSCCCKRICIGCEYANTKREFEGRLEHKCPFCRYPMARGEHNMTYVKNYLKRAEANDPVAMLQMGSHRKNAGDHSGAIEYWTKAAKLGDMDAHHNLSLMYCGGHGVEKDMKKELYHLEEAAIGGHADARHNLGNFEAKNGRTSRAIKHWIIAANMGRDGSLEALKKNYAIGIVSKEDFASALRGHKAAVDATKSPQRAVAEAVTQAMQK